MKTEDRVSAAARRQVAVGPMAGDRLPAPPRERKPALAALAALLVLAGALGATMLVLQAGDRIDAIKITSRVSAGQQITEDAITTVSVAENSAINYVTWSQRDALGGYVAKTDLVEGTVLVGDMLAEESALAQDKVIVGLSLQPGQYPPGLTAGDTVDAYWVGDATSTETEEKGTDGVLADSAKVVEIRGEEDEADGNSAISLRLRIDQDDAAALTRPASDGEVAVVIVPTSGTSE